MNWIEKYYPVIANINILAILVLWWFGIDLRGFTAYLLGCAVIPNILLFYYSKKRHYCLWHRVLLANTIFYGLLHMTEKYLMLLNIEFNYYFYIALVVTVISLLVSTALFVCDGCFKRPYKRTFTDGKGVALRGIRKNERGVAKVVEVFRNTILFHLHKNTAK